MIKKIFVLNGKAGVGKDTFATNLNKYIPTKHISSITPVKKAARFLGISGEKNEEYREFLYSFKKFLNEKSTVIWDVLDEEVRNFRNNDTEKVLLIDIREPDEIKKACKRYSCKSILVIREGITNYSNLADSNVLNYESYDYVINNDGSLEDLDDLTKAFSEEISKASEHKVVAVDFDNTIAFTDYPTILSPIPETIELLQNIKEKGATIILWTCREGKELAEAIEWCKKNNVPIDLVNENDKTRIEHWGNNCRKIGADLYIDDRAFSLIHDRRDNLDIMDYLFN